MLNLFSWRSFVFPARVCTLCCVFLAFVLNVFELRCLTNSLLFVWSKIVSVSLRNDFRVFCIVAEVSWLYLESCDFLGLAVLV